MYKVSIINSFEPLLSLRDEWENLRVTNGFSLFSSFDWYWCWIRASQDKIMPFIIVIKNERTDAIEGILPLQRDTKYFLSGLTSIVNGDTQCFEFIIERKYEEKLTKTLHDFFSQLRSISYVEFNPVSENHSALMSLAILNNNSYFVNIIKQSPYLPCIQPFEDLLQNKSKKSRQRTRYLLNRLDRLGKVKIEKLIHLQPTDFDDLIKISKDSWKGEVGSAINSKETTETFFRLLSEVAEQHEWLQVWFLSVNGQRLAMEFHLREGDKVYALRGDYLNEYKKYSPGRYLDYHIIKSLCDDQQTQTYDMCGDLYDYKLKWTQTTQQFFRILWIKNSLIHKLYCVKKLIDKD